MNRQMRRRVNRNLNLKKQDIDDLAEHFRKENEEANRVIAAQFLALTVEALRLEFGFVQARIDRYAREVNSLLESEKALAKIGEDFLSGDAIDNYKLIENNLDEVDI